MKVVLLNTYQTFGGAAVAAGRLHRALLRQGIGSKLLVQELMQPEFGVVPLSNNMLAHQTARFRFIMERLAFLPYEKDKSVRFQFSPAVTGSNLTFNSLIREADIIHLHWINFGFQSVENLGNLLSLDKPVVWTMHDMWPFTGGCHHSGTCENYQGQCGNCEPLLRSPSPDDLSYRVWKRKAEAYVQGHLTPVACSDWLAGRARKSGLFRSLPVESIPNPLNTNLFSPTEKTRARQQLKLPTDKKLILFAATKVGATGKGFAYFREALHQLRGQLQNPDEVELLIFGAGDKGLLAELPFQYHYLGSLSDAEKISLAYSAANVFVIPSLAENLPNTIMESMACGTPVVGFDVGGIPEMIQHQHNGYLADYLSVEDLAEGMRWTLEASHTDYQTLTQNARQYAVDHYSQDVIAERYIALYQQLISERVKE
jgi:glycosyltransferase involved in cell wall biosynthesis